MSDEVSDFLRSVELLKGRREEEGEARSKDLEQKILHEKRERQARRAERARSISPQKSSPANSPSPAAHRITAPRPAPDGNRPPSPGLESSGSPRFSRLDLPDLRLDLPDFSSDAAMDRPADYFGSPTKENDSPFDADDKRPSLTSPSAGLPSARPALSWQRRPMSQHSDRSKSRPLSMVAAENAASRSSPAPPEPATVPEQQEDLTRDQISQSLAGKDPAWFRQTADRGQNSAAFRRNQVEDQDTLDMSSLRAQLPGMSRDTSADLLKERPTTRSGSPALPQLGSPLPITSAQRLDPPAAEVSNDTEVPSVDRRTVASPGRTSPSRPISPTKGMGGFVQSAMMKRSDSVKRWSVSSPGGLQRADSVASIRTATDNLQRGSTPKSAPRPGSMLREDSTSSSRPTSSHEKEDDKRPLTPIPAAEVPEEPEVTSPPSSPSKTMDPRRWSPSKSSSWLEAALNKPEPSPKPSPSPVNQPAWMVELNKAKAQKAGNPSVELARSPSTLNPSLLKKPEVKTGGLMRSSPMNTTVKPIGLGAFPSVPGGDKPVVAGFRGTLTKPSSRRGSEDPSSEGQGTADDSAPIAKSKAATPPKKDFRANLKPRVPPPEPKTEQPDELKAVFGTLRRAKTEKYVAPDELKSNILRGKNSLNATNGPKRNEKKDEFKEALLKKKDEFKKAQQEGRGVARAPSSVGEKSIPEGLAKKLELNRSGFISRPDSAASDSPLESPSFFTESNRSSYLSIAPRRDSNDVTAQTASRVSLRVEKEPAAGLGISTPFHKEAAASPARLQTKIGNGGLADRFNPALAGLLARGPPPAASGASKSPVASGVTTSGPGAAEEEEAAARPSPQLTHMTKNRARGPRRKAPTSVMKAIEGPEEPAAKVTPRLAERALGSPKAERPTSSFPKAEKPATPPKPEAISRVDSGKSIQEKPQAVAGNVISLVDSSKRGSAYEPSSAGQPIALVDSPSPIKTRPRSPTKVHEQVAALAALSQQSAKAAEGDTNSQPSSPRKLDFKRMSKFLDDQGQLIPKPEPEKSSSPTRSPTRSRAFTASANTFQAQQLGSERINDRVNTPPLVAHKTGSSFFAPPSSLELGKSQPSSPTKERSFPDLASPSPTKPARDTRVDSRPIVSPKSTSPPPSAFNGAQAFRKPTPTLDRPTSEPEQPPQLPPKSADRPAFQLEQPPRLPPKGARPLPAPPRSVKTPPPVSSPTRSPSKYGADVTKMLDKFFGSERPRRSYTADAAEILTRRPLTDDRIQTQRVQLFQFSGDGKKVPVSAHYERVLFEREMYLCPHSFTNGAGKKVNEVYFWAGDDVPESSVQDAHIFAQREARSFGGKLVKLVQGKETAEFLQALGGIVIVRRGSSNKYDSLASNMLCGRRYLGQVVFDEVDFVPSSLCSGFPYLITQQGQCYLWKGKGSDVDELGCARLVGMDLALMGELTEMEEGNEPPSFFDNVFGGGARADSADHWRLKPNYDRYCGRLFFSNAADRQQITEIFPFKQTDLLPTNIYVLDAFFEMYIIVGARSQHQYADFRNALDFAQEYSILAAGMEDRPFVPVATVVLEGMPRDLKSVFRKWRDAASPTFMNPNNPTTPNLKRGRSLRIVSLNQALVALNDKMDR